MKRLWHAVALALLVSLAPGCASLQPSDLARVVAKLSRGASWLSAAVDVAEAGAGAFFARHPHPKRQDQVAAAVRQARLAIAALHATGAAASNADDGKLAEAKEHALAAYENLRKLLGALGVLDAKAPAGGAETSAPPPQPFTLPTAARIGQEMS